MPTQSSFTSPIKPFVLTWHIDIKKILCCYLEQEMVSFLWVCFVVLCFPKVPAQLGNYRRSWAVSCRKMFVFILMGEKKKNWKEKITRIFKKNLKKFKNPSEINQQFLDSLNLLLTCLVDGFEAGVKALVPSESSYCSSLLEEQQHISSWWLPFLCALIASAYWHCNQCRDLFPCKTDWLRVIWILYAWLDSLGKGGKAEL